MSNINTIVTGQQIGLLGGPLYTTYKVLGAVRLAAQLNGNAIYWLETNDADFNEINHIDYLDAEGHLRTLTWDINTRGYSCGYIEVDESLTDLLETFFSTVRQTEFTPHLRDMTLDCYCPGQTLGKASQQLAVELFGHFDLRIFTPFEKDFRQFSRAILMKEAERTPEGGQCNLFCMQGKQRKAVFKKDGGFQLRDGSVVDLSRYDLVPNVNTRSVCQDAYFHTHTYVAGPGEIKYLSQLEPVFQFHGVKNADVRSRMSVSLIEPRVRRMMNKTGLSLGQIMGATREELIKEVLKKKTIFDFSEVLQKGNNLTDEYLEKLEGLGLETATIKSLRKSLRHEVKNVLGKLRAKEKDKHRHLLTEAGHLSDNLRPFGKPQERVFNIFYYMNLFGGKNFVTWIYDHYDWKQNVLEIKVGN